MVFSSSVFLLLFLPAVYLINAFVSNVLKAKTIWSNCFLVLVSLFFYAWGEPVLVLLMIAVILLNWFCGKRISVCSGFPRKVWLFMAVAGDLSALGYFKYADFLIRTVNGLLGREIFVPPQAALPIGISFFTFQAISYVVDVRRGKTEASLSLINTALYISFFPQLIAGPIVKYRDIHQQIEKRTMSWDRTAEGFRRFIFGLGKKVLIANVLGLCVDTVYSYNPELIDPRAAWIAAIAYTFQIYYDFSGYSDMAIGLGKMFGFDYPENFDYPYLSASISEFWRRWHISLGTWFREYVYIPLGGNRKGKVRTFLNLAVVFLLTGLWHGANISFVLWGAFHGFFIIIEKAGLGKILDKKRFIGILYCFLVVTFGWVLFRLEDGWSAVMIVSRMIRPWHYLQIEAIPTDAYLELKTVLMLIASAAGAGMLRRMIPEKWKDKWKNSVPEAVFCAAILILCIAAIASDTYNPFIYFQF